MRITNNKDSSRYLFYRVDGIVKSIKMGPRETVFVDKLNNENQIIRSALDRKRSSIITRFNRDFVLDFIIEPTLGINACRLMWNNIANTPVTNVDSVEEWNTYFDLPTNGSPFTSVQVYGNDVYLLGGSNIAVAPNLFLNNTSLIGIDDSTGSIISIGDSAFQLSGLKFINFASATTLVGNTQFADLVNTVDYLDMPSLSTAGVSSFGSTRIGHTITFPNLVDIGNAFTNTNIVGDLSLPAAKTVPSLAFENTICNTLNLYNVTGLTASAFETAYVTSINLPLVTSVPNSTFNNCTSLTSINIPNVTSIATNCFRACPITEFSSSLITSVPANAFEFCTALKSVNLPNITTIGSSSFNQCSSLTGVNFSKVTTLGANAFFGCSSMRSVILTACTNVQSSNNFRNCTSLTEINLASCTALGSTTANNSVFQGITGKTITLTIKASRMTALAGGPDGDIAYLQANNTVTVIQT